jgi:hypothetical protein
MIHSIYVKLQAPPYNLKGKKTSFELSCACAYLQYCLLAMFDIIVYICLAQL